MLTWHNLVIIAIHVPIHVPFFAQEISNGHLLFLTELSIHDKITQSDQQNIITGNYGVSF